MNDYRAYVCSGVSIRWLAPIVGVALIEGRIGYDDRVFGAALPGGLYLVWATEAVITKAIQASPKGAFAKLAHEARAEGVEVPKLLAAISGCSSESGAWSDTKIEFDAVTSAAKVAADRQVGVTSAGVGAVPEKVKAKPIKETEEPSEA
jgi:hypothetical protein